MEHRAFKKLHGETCDVISDVTSRFRATDELTSSVTDLEKKQRVVEVISTHAYNFIVLTEVKMRFVVETYS